MATFITSKAIGENFIINVSVTSGFWKYNHNGSDSSVFTPGSNTAITVANANGEFTIISCNSDGTNSGYVTNINLKNGGLTSFDGTGLSGLTLLNIGNNQLTSLTNLPTSLTNLQLSNNQLTSFNGTGLSSLIKLEVSNNQLTSFDGTGLSASLTTLELANNQLTSFDGTDLSGLVNLILCGNQLTSVDVSTMVLLRNFQLSDSYGTLTNPITAVSNDSILSQLNTNGVVSGNFITVNGRTSTGTADYNALIGDGWNLLGLDLVASPTTTTTTTEAPTTTTTTTEAPTTTTTTTPPVVGSGKLRVKGVTTSI